MQSKKYIWITLAFMPMFFILGYLFDVLMGNTSLDLEDIILLLAIYNGAFGIMMYFGLNVVHKKTLSKESIDRIGLDINWDKWEKLGKWKFVLFRVSIIAILGLISLVIFKIAWSMIPFDSGLNTLPSLMICYCFSAMFFITSVDIWEIHQQKNQQPKTE